MPYLYQIDVINIPVDINLTFNYVGNYACKVYWLREDSNNDADNLYEYLFESDYTDNESHIYAKFNISNNTLKNHILYYDKLCVDVYAIDRHILANYVLETATYTLEVKFAN